MAFASRSIRPAPTSASTSSAPACSRDQLLGERGDARGRRAMDMAQQFQLARRQCASQGLEAVEQEMTFLHGLAALGPAARIGATRAHIGQSVVDVDLEFAHVLKVPIKWFLDDEADVRAKLDWTGFLFALPQPAAT